MMVKFRKALYVLPVLLVLLTSACSGVNISSLGSQVGLASQPAQAASTGAVQVANPAADLIAAYEGTLVDVYDKVNPSVVNIDVVETVSANSQGLPNVNPNFGQGELPQQSALGSGFVWDEQGNIVTNNHVVDGADKVTVTFADGTVASAKVVGQDPNSDLAVIKVAVPESQLVPIEVMDSTQTKVGQLAVAIGNPYGLSGTMTVGVISGLDRSLPVGLEKSLVQSGPVYSIPDIIQTDAAINPGNSGGVLVDAQGQLIGVTAAIQSTVQANSGVGFVIPAKIVQMVVPELIKSGKYDHPWMGISGTSLTPDLAKANNLDEGQRGAIVIDVVSSSPAEKAGLQGGASQGSDKGQNTPTGGDVIIAADRQTVNNFEDLVSYLYENKQVGQTVKLTILRDGAEKTIELTLGKLPTSK
jgi:serine protease Do